MSVDLLLVRHGQSTWNEVSRWQGQEDPPLSDRGRAQAAAAAEVLGAFDAIVASDLDRARQTAEIIAAAHGVGPVLLDPDLRERFAGEYQGLTREQIEERFPGDLAARRRPPGWETDELVIERAVRALATISAQVGEGTVLVVTHSGLIYCLEELLEGDRAPRLPNLGGRWLRLDAAGPSLTLGDRVDLAPDVDPPDAVE